MYTWDSQFIHSPTCEYIFSEAMGLCAVATNRCSLSHSLKMLFWRRLHQKSRKICFSAFDRKLTYSLASSVVIYIYGIRLHSFIIIKTAAKLLLKHNSPKTVRNLVFMSVYDQIQASETPRLWEMISRRKSYSRLTWAYLRWRLDGTDNGDIDRNIVAQLDAVTRS